MNHLSRWTLSQWNSVQAAIARLQLQLTWLVRWHKHTRTHRTRLGTLSLVIWSDCPKNNCGKGQLAARLFFSISPTFSTWVIIICLWRAADTSVAVRSLAATRCFSRIERRQRSTLSGKRVRKRERERADHYAHCGGHLKIDAITCRRYATNEILGQSRAQQRREDWAKGRMKCSVHAPAQPLLLCSTLSIDIFCANY